ncbi:ATP-binding protein [Streptomyces pratensis]|uniref:ATP-binding protein n=1 Tax=Streptomyces pratensis TaxID=1169025 RepID=UPI00301A06E3
MTPALFGRDHPASVLRSEIVRATDSHGGLVLVTGEAGIGKTTLVTSAAHEARRRGALVVGGSCWDSDSTPGYWPWVQVLRGLRRSVTAAEWAAAQEASDGRLGVLLGDPGARTDTGAGAGAGAAEGTGAGAAPTTETGQTAGAGAPEGAEAFGLFDAVTTALVTLSQSRPLVVVLDDLHSADPASLRLLEFAAQHAWFERLLLVGTYRDVEVEAPGHPLQQLILPLVSRASTTLTLSGLGREDAGALMAATTGREPAPQLVEEVHRRTGGNPFFIEQTARLWHSGSPVSTIPPGVREAVRQRLALLPKPVVSLLTSAAVLGREFDKQVLAVVHGAPAPHVHRLLEAAIVARVLVPRPSGQCAFAHDLLHETLYASLGDAEARSHHANTVRALDGRSGPADTVRPGDLARHAHLAGSELERDRRIDLLLAAARDASGRLAEEEALSHYRRALAVASGEAVGDVPAEPLGPSQEGPAEPNRAPEGAPAEPSHATGGNAPAAGAKARGPADAGPDHRRTALICLDLAGQLRHSGETAEAQRLQDRAVALARQLDEPELLAQVAITVYRDGSLDGHRAFSADLLAEAHRRVTGTEDQENLSDDRLAQILAIHIMALARRGCDDEALAFSLWARHDSVWGLGSAEERLGLTDEMTVVGRRTRHQDMELHAVSMRWVALLELGDPAFIDQFRLFVRLAEQSELPRFAVGIAVDTSLIASLQGRFVEASTALDHEALRPESSDHAAFGFMRQHLRWSLCLLRGHFTDAEEVLTALPDVGYPHPELLEAVTAVEQGDAAPALRLIAERSSRADPYPRAILPLWLRLLAQTAALTGDARLVTRAEDELAPYTGQWVVSLYGCDIGGPVDLWLGLLAAARDDQEAAVAALTGAAASADRLGARPWAVRARLDLARSLLARAAAGDAGQARRLLVDVSREATALGLDHLATEAAALLASPAAPARRAPLTPRPTAVPPSQHPAAEPTPEPTPGPGPDTARVMPTGAKVAGTEVAGTRAAGPRPGSERGTEPDGEARDDSRPGEELRARRPSGEGAAAKPAPASPAAPVSPTSPAAPASPPTAAAAPASPPAAFRRDGPVWQLCWEGVTVHVPDAKGLRDLHSLLNLPGTDVPAVRLLAAEGGSLAVAAGQFGGDPVLDEEAKRRYREHLARLDSEIDRAAARGDARQVEKYDRERQALLDELRTAAGLGGRTRRLGDQAERARKTVTARIRDTLRKLETLHPALAAHLKASVATGTTCAYRPEHAPHWQL